MTERLGLAFRTALGTRGLTTAGLVLLAILAINVATISAQVVNPAQAVKPVYTAINTGAPVVVPKGVNGYTVSIAQEWVGGYSGFTPIRVTIETNPVKATINDERFVIQSQCRQYGSAEMNTSTELIIPAGQKSGTAEIYVPEKYAVNAHQNTIFVSTISGRHILNENALAQNAWVNQPKIMVISNEFPARRTTKSVCYSGKSKQVNSTQAALKLKSTLPSFGHQQSLYNNGGMAPNINQNAPAPNLMTSWNALRNGIGMHYSQFADLPQSWIGLQGVDQILISHDQLKSLTQTNELQRSNLEKWVVTGGVLIVYDTGPKFKKAKQIWPLLLGADRDFIAETNNVEWRTPSSYVAKLGGLVAPGSSQTSYNYGVNSNGNWLFPDNVQVQGIDVSKWKTYGSPDEFPKETPLGICDYLDGKIVAVDSDMSKWKPKDWQLLHNSIASSGRQISQRVASSAIGDQYNSNFQIPGVGEPPVRSFQVLIGLFLLFAGPIMVILLRRTKQMQYLFIAVPVLSALVCSSLFFYAIIVDGSNRWGRCQTVTHLDHQTSMAVTHARAMYYCGKHPGRYEMPIDGIGLAYGSDSNPSQVEFANGLMKISGGKIAARIPHEVTTVRPYATNSRLLVTPAKVAEEEDSKSDSDAPEVQNRLGAEVRWALIRTEDGYFSVKNLEDGQKVSAIATSPSAEFATIKSIVTKASPQVVGALYQNRRYASSAIAYDSVAAYQFGDDQVVVERLRSGSLKGLLDQPNSYIALLEEFPLAAEQLEPVEYKMQLHVVRGQW